MNSWALPQASTTNGKQAGYLKWAVNRCVLSRQRPINLSAMLKAIIRDYYGIKFWAKLRSCISPIARCRDIDSILKVS